jgi:electron transport complex protein RnfC
MNIRSIFGFLPPRLLYSCTELPVTDVSLPKQSVILLGKSSEGAALPALVPGDLLKTGGKILDSKGNLLSYSPVTGAVAEIYNLSGIDEDFNAVSVNTSEQDIWDENRSGAGNYLEMEPAALVSLLCESGFSLDINNGKKPDAVILNCLESDLLISINRNVLAEYGDSLRKGLVLLKRISGSDEAIIAVPGELRDIAEQIAVRGGERIAVVDVLKPVYPFGMKEVIPRVLSRKKVRRPLVITPEYLNSIVLFLEMGSPAVQKFVTLIDRNGVRMNMKVRIGTPVSHVLREGNVKITELDKLVLGGSMRGRPIFHAEFPVTADIDAILIQGGEAVVAPLNETCVGCGKCVGVCPNKLQVNLLARYAEFNIFERCRELDIDHCIECGLCAYVCMSRRSTVQYLTYAKKELAIMEKEGEHAIGQSGEYEEGIKSCH